jgi:type I restriction enzyme M protein
MFMAFENKPEYTIARILKSTGYGLDIFNPAEISAVQLFDKKGKPYLRDFVDAKER